MRFYNSFRSTYFHYKLTDGVKKYVILTLRPDDIMQKYDTEIKGVLKHIECIST